MITKEQFITMVQWLRRRHATIEEIQSTLDFDDIWDSPLVDFDDMVKQFCYIAGLDFEVKDIIYDLIWDGRVALDVSDEYGTNDRLMVDEEEYWNIFLNPNKN